MENNYDLVIGTLQATKVLPDLRLAPYIEDYKFCEGDHCLASTTIKPVSNGRIELFIHFGASHIIIHQNNRKYLLNNYLVGLNEISNSVYVEISRTTEKVKGMIVRFTYKGVCSLLSTTIADISNQVLTFEDLWGTDGKQFFEELYNAISDEERMRIANKYFLRFLAKDIFIRSIDLDEILRFMKAKMLKITVENLAHLLNMSYGTLYRKFMEELGISPKEFLKTIRFNSVCEVISSQKEVALGDILYYGGYYDQAHFIHEFKEIMKIPPGELLNRSNGNFFITRGFTIN